MLWQQAREIAPPASTRASICTCTLHICVCACVCVFRYATMPGISPHVHSQNTRRCAETPLSRPHPSETTTTTSRLWNPLARPPEVSRELETLELFRGRCNSRRGAYSRAEKICRL